MIVLLFSAGDRLGGIETLILRLISYWVVKGQEVRLICRAPSAFTAIPQHMTALGASFSKLIQAQFSYSIIFEQGIKRADYVIAFDQESAVIAPVWAKRLNAKPVYTNWVPDFYRFLRENKYHPMSWLMRRVLRRCYGPKTCFNMISDYDNERKRILGVEWDAGVFPIPINLAPFLSIKRKPVRTRVVSVSRLDSMKEYVLTLPEIGAALRREGIDLEIEIYGEGPLRDEIQEKIQRNGMEGFVNLKGEVPYHSLPDVFATAGVFIGMGTACLEAAAAGVPTVYAKPYSHLGESCGSICASDCLPTNRHVRFDLRIKSELRRLLKLDNDQYRNESTRNRESAKALDMDDLLESFLSDLRSAETIRMPCSLITLVSVYGMLRGVRDGMAGLYASRRLTD